MDSIWLYNPKKYADIKNESRKYILHPKILELVNQSNAKELLDYGCGDGSLLKHIDKEVNVSIYDISSKSVHLAKRNLKGRKIKVFYDNEGIPKESYDCVILSLVLMTISNKQSIINELTMINSLLKENGEIIVGITHPCFRQFNFSSFHTSYLDDENFNYLQEGKKFKVTIRDPRSNKNIAFNDYHWTLTTSINSLVKSGFEICELIELPDKSFEDSYENKGIPPYMIIKGKKKKNAL